MSLEDIELVGARKSNGKETSFDLTDDINTTTNTTTTTYRRSIIARTYVLTMSLRHPKFNCDRCRFDIVTPDKK